MDLPLDHCGFQTVADLSRITLILYIYFSKITFVYYFLSILFSIAVYLKVYVCLHFYVHLQNQQVS